MSNSVVFLAPDILGIAQNSFEKSCFFWFSATAPRALYRKVCQLRSEDSQTSAQP